MAKKQEKETYDASKANQAQGNQNYNDFTGRQRDQNEQSGGSYFGQQGEAYNQYKNFADTGGLDPELKRRLIEGDYSYKGVNGGGGSGGSSGGGGGGGKVSPPGPGNKPPAGPSGDHYSKVGHIGRGTYDAAEAAFDAMNKEHATRFAETGGLEDADLDRWRGLGVYDDFAKTGGISEEDEGNMRAKALSPIGAFRQQEMDEMARRRNVQGGYGFGMDAAQRALKRDTARNIADTSLNAELGISDRRREGKMWGAEGASRTESDIEKTRTQNQIQGMQTLAQIEQAVASGKMSAAQGRAQIDMANQQTDLAIASGRTQKDIAELQRRAAAGNASAMKELANAQLAAQNMRFVTELEQQGKLAGAQGMGAMAGMMGNYGSEGMNRELAAIGGQNRDNISWGGLRSQQADQIGGFGDNLMKGLNIGAGVAGAMFAPGAGGGGWFGGQQPRNVGMPQTGYFA